MVFTNHYYQVLKFIQMKLYRNLSLAGIFSCQRISGRKKNSCLAGKVLPRNWHFLPRQESRSLFSTLVKINKLNLDDQTTMESLYAYYEKKQALKKRKIDKSQLYLKIKQVFRLLNKQRIQKLTPKTITLKKYSKKLNQKTHLHLHIY